MNNKPTKPLCLELDEAEKELNAMVEQIAAKHGLPCYLLEPIVSDVLNKLQNGKRIEIENAKRSYEQMLAERSENDVGQCCDNS